MWTARCKSGYILDSTGRECGRFTSRGALLCSACLNAEVAEPIKTGRFGVLAAVAAFLALVVCASVIGSAVSL